MTAHRTPGLLPRKPAIDALQMENVGASREPPGALAGFKLLTVETTFDTLSVNYLGRS